MGYSLVPAAGLIAPAPAAPADPSGVGWTKGNGSIIEIALRAACYCGTLLSLMEPNEAGRGAKAGVFNEDVSKRGRPLTGIEVRIDLAPDANHWQGKAYKPEDGKTHDITFKVTAGRTPGGTAEIKGSIFKVLCKSETFTKLEQSQGRWRRSHDVWVLKREGAADGSRLRYAGIQEQPETIREHASIGPMNWIAFQDD